MWQWNAKRIWHTAGPFLLNSTYCLPVYHKSTYCKYNTGKRNWDTVGFSYSPQHIVFHGIISLHTARIRRGIYLGPSWLFLLNRTYSLPGLDKLTNRKDIKWRKFYHWKTSLWRKTFHEFKPFSRIFRELFKWKPAELKLKISFLICVLSLQIIGYI